MNKKVLGLGVAAMDVVLQCESLPQEDGFAFIHSEQLMPGGSCANVLVTLARLGTAASLVAAVGDDHYGTVFLEDLTCVGVNTENVKIRKKGVTLHTFVTVDNRGNRSIFVNPGDSLLTLRAEEVDGFMLEGAVVFYTDMFPGKPALKLARLAREQEIPVVFVLECAPSFMQLCGISREEINEMLSYCGLFCAGREALREFAGEVDPKKAAEQLYLHFQPPLGLIATLGDEGAIWVHREQNIHMPAFSVKAVDTTGAGDAFCGGLIHAYFIQKLDRKASLQFAAACAALKCTYLGPRFKFGEKEVKQFLREQMPSGL